MKKFTSLLAALTLGLMISSGCKKAEPEAGDKSATAETPTFVLGWSEYPSSSMYGVADELKLINGKRGEMGPLEQKWGVDVELIQTDYDTLVTMYGGGKADAVCITNLDCLAPALGRKATAIIPVSNSFGGDAVVVAGSVQTVDDLKGKTTKGLKQSVSQYTFQRNLELLGKNVADYPYSNMDPGAAANAMQQKQNGMESIVVWNPFISQTLKSRPDAKVLFSSQQIPEEIVDVVLAGNDSLQKPGGENFAALVCDVFYQMNARLNDAKTGDEVAVALGAKFSNLNAVEMRETLKTTRFYPTPDDALKLLADQSFRNEKFPKVAEWCEKNGLVNAKAKVGFDDETADLNYSSKYVKMAKDKK